MKVLLTALVNILALLGYVLTYLKKDRLGGYRPWLIVLCAVLASAVIWGKHCDDASVSRSKDRDYAFIKSELTEIRKQNDTLKVQLNETVKTNKNLLGYLEPFNPVWDARYPGLGPDQAFAALARDLQAKGKAARVAQTGLELLTDQTKVQKSANSGLIQTRYLFRSRYTMPLRDISIRLQFDDRLARAQARITGAVVIDQGSRLSVAPDSAELTYSTGYLSESNDIMIEVAAQKPLNIVSMQLRP